MSNSNYLKSGYDPLLKRSIYPSETQADNINSDTVLAKGSLSLSNLSGDPDPNSGSFDTEGNLITDIINARIDTQSKKILQAFNVNTDDYSGAVKAGDITWDLDTGEWQSGAGVVVSKAGIIGASITGVTFSLDASDGSATFAGDLVGASGTFGSIYSANSGYRIGLLTIGGTGQLVTYNGTTLIGAIYTDANGWMRLVAPSNSIMLSSGGFNVFEVALSGALPAANDTFDLGLTGRRWRNLYLSGSAVITTGINTGAISCNSVSAVTLSGSLTGNVNGNCSGSHSGSFSGSATISSGSFTGSVNASGGTSDDNDVIVALDQTGGGGSPVTNVKFKKRSINFSNGICTGWGGVSDWINAD